MEIYINNKLHSTISSQLTNSQLKQYISDHVGLNPADYYLISQGKRIEDDGITTGTIHVIPRTVGGKGGFGSMLRAIGAQIEKTTNREACRDLSGRRLRDINEEQRLKNWINQQAEREKEAKERKKKKLERLCEKPKHEFKDAEYDKERSELPEIVEDAVLQGLQASCSTKRKIVEKTEPIKKKKAKLWVDDGLDDLSSSGDESESDCEDKQSETVKNSNTEDLSSAASSTSNIRPESNNQICSDESSSGASIEQGEKQETVDLAEETVEVKTNIENSSDAEKGVVQNELKNKNTKTEEQKIVDN